MDVFEFMKYFNPRLLHKFYGFVPPSEGSAFFSNEQHTNDLSNGGTYFSQLDYLSIAPLISKVHFNGDQIQQQQYRWQQMQPAGWTGLRPPQSPIFPIIPTQLYPPSEYVDAEFVKDDNSSDSFESESESESERNSTYSPSTNQSNRPRQPEIPAPSSRSSLSSTCDSDDEEINTGPQNPRIKGGCEERPDSDDQHPQPSAPRNGSNKVPTPIEPLGMSKDMLKQLKPQAHHSNLRRYTFKRQQQGQQDRVIQGSIANRPQLHPNGNDIPSSTTTAPTTPTTPSPSPSEPNIKLKTEKEFPCSFCGKKFNRRGNLNIHLCIHTGERPFKCETCGRRFIRKQNLKNHQATHTGEKPFKCDECGKCFARKTNRTRHEKIHRDERPFLCTMFRCGKRFSTKSILKSHTKLHLPRQLETCSLCGKSFKTKMFYIKHMKKHEGGDAKRSVEKGVEGSQSIEAVHLKRLKGCRDIDGQQRTGESQRSEAGLPRTSGAKQQNDVTSQKHNVEQDGSDNEMMSHEIDAQFKLKDTYEIEGCFPIPEQQFAVRNAEIAQTKLQNLSKTLQENAKMNAKERSESISSP